MLRISTFTVIVLLAACVGAAGPQAANSAAGAAGWPQWAGPNGNCTSDEKGLLKEWPKEGPKVLWRIPVGIGSNHPSVVGDDLCYAQLNEEKPNHGRSETIACVDANTGMMKWSHTYDVPPIWWVGWGELGVRATPTITDKYVYEVGTFGDAFCFDRKTGKIVWQHNFREDNPYFDPAPVGGLKKGFNLEWKGFNGSLIPVGDKIFYFYFQGGNPPIPAWTKTDMSQKMQFLALDVNTGKVAWKFEEECRPGSRGPGLITGGGMPLKFQGEDCLVVHGNRDWKILRQSDGKQVWRWECTGLQDSPAWACGGLRPVGKNLYMDSLDGWQPSLIECDFSVSDPKPKVLWTNTHLHAAITPFVIWKDYIYGWGFDNAGAYSENPGETTFFLQCTELKTGKRVWKQPGFRMGVSIIAADGMLYVHDYQKLTLVEATPSGYVEKGRVEKLHSVPNTGKDYIGRHLGLLDWDMPVISQGRLYVRTPAEIICYDIKDPSAK